MPSTRDLRRRIKSIKNTSQITKAMQMVAASKMRRAQQAALAGRPYAELMNHVLAQVTANTGDFSHPLMEMRDIKRAGVIVVSPDKGLCGAMTTNLLKLLEKRHQDHHLYISAGRKAAQHVAKTRKDLNAEFQFSDVPKFAEARSIAHYAIQAFENKEIDRVEVIYTNFINTLTQEPEVFQLLPIGKVEALTAGVEGQESGADMGTVDLGVLEYLFEPGAGDVFGALLPHYLNYRLFQILLESKASEHSSRMVAMKSATDNANQLIKDLTLEYNKVRQAAITNELLEITTAAMAVG